MNNEFSQTSFTIEITADGSPTLKLPGEGESMHYSGGAATETDFIYKAVIEDCLKIWPEAEVAILGLGLGYIEISWALVALKLGLAKTRFVSFETEEILKEKFLNWLYSKNVNAGQQESHVNIYDQICHFMHSESDMAAIKKRIIESLSAVPLKGNLKSQFDKNKSYNLICYDAYSTKTSGELWSEEFLDDFLEKSCHENCVVTSYACTGILKRALKKHNFTLLDRRRFRSSKDSTLAVRGVFKSAALTFRTS